MPFKSRAQQGYLHAHPEILGEEKLAEFDASSKGKKLPARKKKSPKKESKPEVPVVRMRHTA